MELNGRALTVLVAKLANSLTKLNFKNVVFWYKNSLDTSELKDTGSIKGKAAFTSRNNELVGQAVKYWGKFKV